MRHAFSFPEGIRGALKNHIEKAVSGIDMKGYLQEPAYTSALARSLEGTVYEGKGGYVKIKSTIVSDRGPHSAEKRFGADLSITASISDGTRGIRKAILIQSKLGRIDELSPSVKKMLKGQIQKMKNHTRSPKVMEIPVENGQRRPKIISGQRILGNEPYRSYELSDYFVNRILTTFDGDTRREFVDAVQESKLTQLNLIARFGIKQSVINTVKQGKKGPGSIEGVSVKRNRDLVSSLKKLAVLSADFGMQNSEFKTFEEKDFPGETFRVFKR